MVRAAALDAFSRDEYFHLFCHLPNNAVPAAPICQGEEPGRTSGLVHDDLCCCIDQRVLRLALMSISLWVLAISCWISDRFGFSFWQNLNFCYLHGI
ncbi:alkaline ceramidase 1-like [Myxocyprinus asiaticus]|uniref:alkaline ceramidase 1-like n=1 Tax=Myxocyprinus asiaticus TaxID=70543 RepID=UPI002222C38A|nr:alkaline ceramidase 1-like [Myxocyprinus asiaticus]